MLIVESFEVKEDLKLSQVSVSYVLKSANGGKMRGAFAMSAAQAALLRTDLDNAVKAIVDESSIRS